LKTLLASLLISCLVNNVSAQQQIIETGEQWIEQISADITNITTEELVALAKDNQKIELIDVRAINEIAHSGGMIRAGRRTHHINRGWFG